MIVVRCEGQVRVLSRVQWDALPEHIKERVTVEAVCRDAAAADRVRQALVDDGVEELLALCLRAMA